MGSHGKLQDFQNLVVSLQEGWEGLDEWEFPGEAGNSRRQGEQEIPRQQEFLR